jgi:hypothetical protein
MDVNDSQLALLISSINPKGDLLMQYGRTAYELFRSLAIKEQRQVFYHRVRFDDDAER